MVEKDTDKLDQTTHTHTDSYIHNLAPSFGIIHPIPGDRVSGYDGQPWADLCGGTNLNPWFPSPQTKDVSSLTYLNKYPFTFPPTT